MNYGKPCALLFLALIMILSSLSLNVFGVNCSIKVYIYCFSGSHILENMKSYFNGIPEVRVIVCDLSDPQHLKEFLSIVTLLISDDVSVLPSNFCTPCELARGLDWQDIYIRYLSPLLLFFKDGRLKAIVVSLFDQALFDQIFDQPEDTAALFLRSKSNATKLSENVRMRIENLFKNKINAYISIFQVLPLVIAAACADAVNPCEFFVLIVFLSLVVIRLGKRAVLKFGVAFSLAVFAAYFMMGLGIWRLIGYVREAKIFVVILGLSLGFRSILNFIFGLFGLSISLREAIGGFLNKRFKRMPNFLSEKVTQRLRGFSDRPLSAFFVGVVTSIFLLPCTSGPYLIALSLIADMESQIGGLLLLTLYNSIIVTPFMVITLGIYLLKIKTSELKRWHSTKQGWLNLISGLIIMALSIYLMIYTL